MGDQVGFVEQVLKQFAFLVDEFGFRHTGCRHVGDNLSVEYCSDRVYVRILKTGPDFEPRFVVGRIGVDDREGSDSFDWGDIGGLDCCRHWKWNRDEEQPGAGRVAQLARLLRECGGSVLRAEESVFTEMIERRAMLHKQHVQEERQRWIRTQAEAAWKNRDFGEVRRLYESLDGDLTPTEAGRHKYAAAHLRG